MEMTIHWPEQLTIPNQWAFRLFVQGMANRLIQGHCRYGAPRKTQRYMDRLEKEVKMYRITGNMEHLINIANYCHLESVEPQNPRFHYDPAAPSATRVEG